MNHMKVNFRRRNLIKEWTIKKCPSCQIIFDEANFCPQCGSKLVDEKIKIYSNIGKKGITSYSIVLPDGKTINSKGKITFNIGGVSFTDEMFSEKYR